MDTPNPDQIVATEPPAPAALTVDEAAARLEQAMFEAKRVLVGQDHMVERLFVAWLARGHCLLEGAPGLAKTLAANTVATIVGGTFKRIQFTPDLVPSDLVGTRIYRPSTETFDVELGPVFANVVLADEINRAPAKVQSALLEVMAERQVSIGGATHRVPTPFIVLATQNPIEHEGVYPLPEAQRDRFLMKVVVGYPDAREEAEIVRRMSVAPPSAHQVFQPDELASLQAAVDEVFVHDAVLDYAVRLVLATRRPTEHGLGDLDGLIAHGGSPRATLGLIERGTGARAPASPDIHPAPGRLRREPRRAPAPGALVVRRDRRRAHSRRCRRARGHASRRPARLPRPGRTDRPADGECSRR